MTAASIDIPAGYHETFRDDFSGTTLDRANWQIVYGGLGSNTNFTWSDADVIVTNGALKLDVARAGTAWTAGGISQGGTGVTYGLFQVRAKADPGQGVGPALLLWPTSNMWPGPEVDLLESPASDRSAAVFTLHWTNTDDSNQYVSQSYPLDVTAWHTYAVDWEPGEVTYSIDGQQLYQTTVNVPSQPLWVALQAEVASPGNTWYSGSPNAGTPDNVGVYVDWVSISQADVKVPEPASPALLGMATIAAGLVRQWQRRSLKARKASRECGPASA